MNLGFWLLCYTGVGVSMENGLTVELIKKVTYPSKPSIVEKKDKAASKVLVLDNCSAGYVVRRYNAMLNGQIFVVLTRLLLITMTLIKGLSSPTWARMSRVQVELGFFFLAFNALHFIGVVLEGVSQWLGYGVFGREKWLLVVREEAPGRGYDLSALLYTIYDYGLRSVLPVFMLTGDLSTAMLVGAGVATYQILLNFDGVGVIIGGRPERMVRVNRLLAKGGEVALALLSWVSLLSLWKLPVRIVVSAAWAMSGYVYNMVARVEYTSAKLLGCLDSLDHGNRLRVWNSGKIRMLRATAVQRDLDVARLVSTCVQEEEDVRTPSLVSRYGR